MRHRVARCRGGGRSHEAGLGEASKAEFGTKAGNVRRARSIWLGLGAYVVHQRSKLNDVRPTAVELKEIPKWSLGQAVF